MLYQKVPIYVDFPNLRTLLYADKKKKKNLRFRLEFSITTKDYN